MSRCRKRERGTSGRWRQSAPCPCWAAPIDASLVSDLRSPIGIVDQDRRTRTDVELRRQQHIGGKTPLDEFFARAALAQRVVQIRLYGTECCQGHQGFWRAMAVEMTDDGSGTDEVFKSWAQTAIVFPTFARRDYRDLSAILPRDSSDGPSVSQTS